MIDSHCHLTAEEFTSDLDDVLLRADEHGVGAMLCIADSLESSKKCVNLAEKYEQIFCTIGVHPHHAKDWNADCASALRRLHDSSVYVKAIGEIGLDYHYDFSPRDAQKAALEAQVALANELGRPVVLHNRESLKDLKEIVYALKPEKAVMHCCTEAWNDVKDWIERGYRLSFTGIATYPKSEDIRETVRNCPLGQMMIETDAPYLAPVPHRGKRNEPAFLLEVARRIAEIKGVDLAVFDTETSKNTVEFFGLV